VLFMLELMLTDAGYTVTGYSELSSLEELMRLQPDCFILDDVLPHVSGHIICIMLKSKPETFKIPVILTSGSDRLEYMAGLSEPDAAIKKPFDEQQLLQTVELLTAAPYG